jgi:hypothetical protein
MSSTKKILKYKTDRLPLHFIVLGYMLLAVGVWRIVVADYKGILYLIFAFIFILFRSGIEVYVDKKQIKLYNGFFFAKMGKLLDVKNVTGLELTYSSEIQHQSVLTLTKTDSVEICKLSLNFPDNDVLLMAGEKEKIVKRANEISRALQIPLVNQG